MEVKTWLEDEVQKDFSHCHNLKDVIKALEKAAESVGQVVCSVSINGLKLSEQDELQLASTALNEIKTLQIEIQDPKKLVADTLISLRGGMANIRDRAVEIADIFRKGDVAQAQRKFSGIMDQTQYTMDALRALKPRLKPNENAMAQWKKAEEQIQSTIKEIMAAYTNKDYVLLADVLEYEVYNSMLLWIETVDRCDFD